MKIGILTLPFVNNYGGILQNYALQLFLKKIGHDPITLDLSAKKTPLWIFWGSLIKSFVLYLFPQKRRPFAKTRKNARSVIFDEFIQLRMNTTERLNSLSSKIISKYKFDALVVGSDQVWRPKYAQNIEDYFLGFLKNERLKRVAYSASFGVENWEYTPKQTEVCSLLAKKFDAIGVREESGVKLCKDYLGVDGKWVLDPTLLLEKEDYAEICEDVPVDKSSFLAAYVLNSDEFVLQTCSKIAKEKNLELKIFSADSLAKLSIPEWLAMFRDAAYVVTDSFHGTVFSIIFEKEFECIHNESRGSARFESLLKLYESRKIEEMRAFSRNWLRNALES